MIGFIYIWRDRKKNRYYVGSHWGEENDGYICSSTWLKQAYKKRPQDFKRRILERFEDRTKTNEIEHRWLQMIRPEELRVRYYNLCNFRFGHWSTDECSRLTVGQKISLKVRGRQWTEEQKRKLRGRIPKNKGIPMSEERKANLSKKLKGRPLSYERSTETRKKMSENGKRLQREQKIGMHGKKHSLVAIAKIAEANRNRKQ